MMRCAPLAAMLLLCAIFGPGVSAETPPQGATDSGTDDPVQAANSNRAASRRSIPQHPAPFRASFDINSYGTTEFWNWVSESESWFEPFGKQARENGGGGGGGGGGGVGLFETPSADLASVQSAVRSTDSTIKTMADELPRVLRHFQQQAAGKNSAGAAAGVATDTAGVTAQGGNIFRAELEWKDLMPHGPIMTPGGGGAEKVNSVRSIPAAAPAIPAGEKRPGRKGSRNKNRPNSGAQVPPITPTAPQAPPQPASAPPPPQTPSALPAQLFAPEPVPNPAPLLAPQPIHVASVAPPVAPQLLRLPTAVPPVAPPPAPQPIRVAPAAAPPLAPLAPEAPQAWAPTAAPPTGQVFLLNPQVVPQPPPAVAPALPVVQVEPRAPPAPAPPKRTKTRTSAQLAARKQKAVERARTAAAGAAGDQSIQQSAEPSKETTQEPQVNVYYHEQLLGSDPALQSASQPTNDPVKDPATAAQKDPESAYQSNPVDAYPSDPTGAYTSDPAGTYTSEQADTSQKDPESAYPSDPAGAYQSEPAGAYQSEPAGAYQSEPAGAYQSDPESAYQTDSAGAYQADPETAYQSDPEGTYQTNPAVDPSTQDDAAEQPPASESIASAPADPINADQGDLVIDPSDQKLRQVAIETAAEPYEQYQPVDDPTNDQTEVGNPPAHLQDPAINGGDQAPADWNQPEPAELQTGYSEPAQAEPQVPYVLKRTKSGSRKNNKGSSDKQPTGRQGTRRPKRIKIKDAAMEQQLATSCHSLPTESHPGSPQATAEAAAGVYEESYSQDQTVGVDTNRQEPLQTVIDSSLRDQAPLLESQGEPIDFHPQEQVALPPQDPYILPELPQEDSTQPPADSSAQFLEPPATSDFYASTDYPALAVETTPESTTDQPEAAPQADGVNPLSTQSETEQDTTEQAPETVSGGDAPLMEPTPEMHRAAQEMHLVPPEVHSVAAIEAEQPIRPVEQTTKPEQEMDDSPTNPAPEAPRRRTKSKSKFGSDPLRTSDLLTNKRKTSASLLTTRKSKVRNQPEPAIQATPAAPVDPVRTKVPSALIRDLDATSYRRKNLSTRRLKSSQNRRSSFTYSPRWRQLQQELQEEQQESYPSNNYNKRHVSSGRRQYEDWFIEPQTPTYYQSSSRSSRSRGQKLRKRQQVGSRAQY